MSTPLNRRFNTPTLNTSHIIVVGKCGAVYLSGQKALEKLGLTASQAGALLADIQMLAVEAAHAIACTKRRLERCRESRGVG